MALNAARVPWLSLAGAGARPGITHWFARDRTAHTVIIVNCESEHGLFSLALLSRLCSLIEERSDGKESDFQKQGAQHVFVLLYMLKPRAFIE